MSARIKAPNDCFCVYHRKVQNNDTNVHDPHKLTIDVEGMDISALMQTSLSPQFSPHNVSITRDDNEPRTSICGQKERDGGTAIVGRKVVGKGCTAVVNTPRSIHGNGSTVGAAAAEAARRELATQLSLASYLCGPLPALQAELGCDAFSIGRGTKSRGGHSGPGALEDWPGCEQTLFVDAAGSSAAPAARRAGSSRSPVVIGSVRFPWGRGAAGGQASFRLCRQPRGTAGDQAGLCRGTSGPRDPVSEIAGELREGEGREEEAGSPHPYHLGWRAPRARSRPAGKP